MPLSRADADEISVEAMATALEWEQQFQDAWLSVDHENQRVKDLLSMPQQARELVQRAAPIQHARATRNASRLKEILNAAKPVQPG